MAANACGSQRTGNMKYQGKGNKKKTLFAADDVDGNDGHLKVNKDYAKKYEIWRGKEEFQKLKVRYGKDRDDTEDTSSSSEDETGDRVPADFDKQFYSTLACLRNKDSKIYDSSIRFFSDKTLLSSKHSTSKKKPKPLFIHDHERELLLATNGKLPDDEDQKQTNLLKKKKENSLTYIEEQKWLKHSFKDALAYLEDDDDDDELFIGVRKIEDEADDYAQTIIAEDKELAKSINNVWKGELNDDNEEFMRDYLVQQKYVDHDNKLKHHASEEILSSESEEFSEQQTFFEHKYNFRFEEPDAEFIKRYPRTMSNLLRRKDTARRDKRQEIKERKKAEKLKKREEIKRLKALKRKEILERLQTIQKITGNDKVGFDEIELDKEFDPEEYDKKMRDIFDDDYYGVEEVEHPIFPEDEELDGDENWDEWIPNYGSANDNQEDCNSEPHCEDPDFVMDCDYHPNAALKQELISSSRKSKRKKGKLTKALLRKKPVFDPNDKTFEEYFDEYFKMDYEDNIGDLLCRFKYRQVIPNDFGLDAEEILAADDKELNRWCSLRKMYQYRTETEEKYDIQAYMKKAHNLNKKMSVLKSVYQTDESQDQPSFSAEQGEATETAEVPAQEERNNHEATSSKTAKKCKKNKKKMPDVSGENASELNTSTANEAPLKKFKKQKNSSNPEVAIPDSRLKAYNINPKKFKNKLKYGKQK